MTARNPDRDNATRQRAYFIWESEGRPGDRADEHWRQASEEAERDDELIDEQEAIVDGLPADLPAVLTRHTRGG